MNLKSVALVVTVCALTYSIYEAPSDNKYSANFGGALTAATKISGLIRDGKKNLLEPFAFGTAKERLASDAMPSFRDVAVWSEISKKETIPPVHHHLWAPVISDFKSPSDSVELMIMERRGAYYVMTFRGLTDEWSSSPVIRDGQPMLISVAVRYYNGDEESEIATIARKVFNTSWMPEFLSKHGEKGRWILIGYEYTFTTRQYYDWVKENGPRLYAQDKIQSAAARTKIRKPEFFKEIEESALDQLEEGELWANGRLGVQLENIRQQTIFNYN